MDLHSVRTAQGLGDPLIGAVVDDRYRIMSQIGRGGMGVVYLAEHVLIQRKVALKTLHGHWTAELVERFRREAMAAAAIGNEHIVDVTDMGQLPNRSHYLVLEYLEGADLAWVIANDGPMSIMRCLRIGIQVCDALQAVHAAGIVHRDLKPENLFLTSRAHCDEFVKVLDFGVCKMRGADEPGARRLTATGVALGTPEFMAPEQIEAGPDVDLRADLYALGAILYFSLTGEPPFTAPSLPRLLLRVCHETAPSIRLARHDASQELADVLARALARDPARRFTAASELRAALLQLLAAEEQRASGEHRALPPAFTARIRRAHVEQLAQQPTMVQPERTNARPRQHTSTDTSTRLETRDNLAWFAAARRTHRQRMWAALGVVTISAATITWSLSHSPRTNAASARETVVSPASSPVQADPHVTRPVGELDDTPQPSAAPTEPRPAAPTRRKRTRSSVQSAEHLPTAPDPAPLTIEAASAPTEQTQPKSPAATYRLSTRELIPIDGTASGQE